MLTCSCGHCFSGPAVSIAAFSRHRKKLKGPVWGRAAESALIFQQGVSQKVQLNNTQPHPSEMTASAAS